MKKLIHNIRVKLSSFFFEVGRLMMLDNKIPRLCFWIGTKLDPEHMTPNAKVIRDRYSR